jgi:hypothetical protein
VASLDGFGGVLLKLGTRWQQHCDAHHVGMVAAHATIRVSAKLDHQLAVTSTLHRPAARQHR